MSFARALGRELVKLTESRDGYLAAFERSTLPEEAYGAQLRVLEEQMAHPRVATGSSRPSCPRFGWWTEKWS